MTGPLKMVALKSLQGAPWTRRASFSLQRHSSGAGPTKIFALVSCDLRDDLKPGNRLLGVPTAKSHVQSG